MNEQMDGQMDMMIPYRVKGQYMLTLGDYNNFDPQTFQRHYKK